MSQTTFIYALLNSEGAIDYIGKSNNPKRRFKDHQRRGFVLAAAPFYGWKRYETFFIEQFLELGGSLRNKNRGGGGVTKHAPETGAKISAMQIGRKASEETRAKMSKSHRGKQRTPAHCLAISRARTGRLQTKDAIAKNRAWHFNKKTVRNTSGFVGVSLRPATGKWRASFELRGNFFHVGNFSKIEDAVFARNLAIANLL